MANEIQRGGQTQRQTAEVSPEYANQQRGSVGTSAVTITFPYPTRGILIKNTHASGNLYVYLQRSSGRWNSVFTTIEAGASLPINLRATRIRMKGAGAGITYEILATLEHVP